MKKQIISFILFLGSLLFVHGQTYLGIQAGLNKYTVLSQGNSSRANPFVGKTFGISLEADISKNASLNFSLLSNEFGYTRNLREGDQGEYGSAKDYGVNKSVYIGKSLTLPVMIKVQSDGLFSVLYAFGFYISAVHKIEAKHYLYNDLVYYGYPIEYPLGTLDAGFLMQFGFGYKLSDRFQVRTQLSGNLGLMAYERNEDFYSQSDKVSNVSANLLFGLFFRLSKSKED